MNSMGFGIRDSGFGSAARDGLARLAMGSGSAGNRNFHIESRFAARGVGFFRIPNPVSRIPEFKP
jgi:hypothetical protein